IAFQSAGGGGYGDPFTRDLELVKRDVLYEYVSIEGARRDYGVVIDPENLEIDYDATAELRSSS
ncbi:MAG: hydantoinase B/oxoprolinase family protein, partial [Gammaproteobacteria bacterium]|nr:hydantoinase B/oxoprolinase family protein [Gammaproteobacteria bacterium]